MQTEHVQTSVVLNMLAVMRPSVFLLFHFYMNSFDVIKIHQDYLCALLVCVCMCVYIVGVLCYESVV